VDLILACFILGGSLTYRNQCTQFVYAPLSITLLRFSALVYGVQEKQRRRVTCGRMALTWLANGTQNTRCQAVLVPRYSKFCIWTELNVASLGNINQDVDGCGMPPRLVCSEYLWLYAFCI
jgi:hypothetical protein